MFMNLFAMFIFLFMLSNIFLGNPSGSPSIFRWTHTSKDILVTMLIIYLLI